MAMSRQDPRNKEIVDRAFIKMNRKIYKGLLISLNIVVLYKVVSVILESYL